jgi:hypothetical protein
VGKIPASDIFAGWPLSQPLDGGWLYRCRGCHLSFRFPRKREDELNALYLDGSGTAWAGDGSLRKDYTAAHGHLIFSARRTP